MSPRDDQKYGVFATLADVDGESVTYGTLGVESIIALTDRTSLEMRGGIGAATAMELDYIFAGARIAHENAAGTLTIHAGYDLAEFDEAGFQALGHEIYAGADFQIARNVSGYVEVRNSRLTGTSAAPDEFTVRAGVTIQFGKFGGSNVKTQPFHTADPIAQFVRRGYF